MTALTEVRLMCDFPGCLRVSQRAETSLADARRESAGVGWTRKPFGRKPRLAYDYCPDHPNGKERADD